MGQVLGIVPMLMFWLILKFEFIVVYRLILYLVCFRDFSTRIGENFLKLL